jgi:hypothetical protein
MLIITLSYILIKRDGLGRQDTNLGAFASTSSFYYFHLTLQGM